MTSQQVVIQCAGMPFWWRPGHPIMADVTDWFLKSYDPGAESGAGWVWTPDLGEAKLFADYKAAHETWTAVNPNVPVRPTDGQPNRPLTMFTVMIQPVDVNEPLTPRPEGHPPCPSTPGPATPPGPQEDGSPG